MFRRMVRLITRVVVWLAKMMFSLATTCITSIWVGIPQATVRIADQWVGEASVAGIPLGYHPAIRTAARIVAGITLFLGWLVLASFTTFLLRLIF